MLHETTVVINRFQPIQNGELDRNGLDIEMIGIAIRFPNDSKTAQKCKMKTRHDRRGFTNVTFWYIGATQKRGGSNFENKIEIEGCKLHE